MTKRHAAHPRTLSEVDLQREQAGSDSGTPRLNARARLIHAERKAARSSSSGLVRVIRSRAGAIKLASRCFAPVEATRALMVTNALAVSLRCRTGRVRGSHPFDAPRLAKRDVIASVQLSTSPNAIARA